MPLQNTPTPTGSQQPKIGLSEILPNTSEPTSLQVVNNYTTAIKQCSTELNALQGIILEANRTGIEAQPHQVAMLQYHRNFPIKKMEAQLARRKFYEVLTVIIQVYFGADKNTPDEVFSECYDRMIKDYGSISIEEVREAHAESSKNALKAFGGMYTVNMFSEIMYAWKIKRNKLIAAIDATERSHEVQEEELAEAKRKEFTKYCYDWLTSQQSNPTVKSYAELNLGMCNELIQSGAVQGKRKDLWDKAKSEAIKQLTADRDEAMYDTNDFNKVRAFNSIISKITEHNYPSDMKGRTEAIYARLLVFDAINKK